MAESEHHDQFSQTLLRPENSFYLCQQYTFSSGLYVIKLDIYKSGKFKKSNVAVNCIHPM